MVAGVDAIRDNGGKKVKHLILYTVTLSVLFFNGCATKEVPPQLNSEPPFEFEEFRDRQLPMCDPHPYIYGSDEGGMWRSNGCSREYIK